MATKNKLSVYLVKEGITSANDIFEDPGKIRVLERYSENSAAYFVPSLAHEPNWLRNFFLRGGDGMLLQANSRVVLIKSIQIDEEYRTFALTFGYARFLFREDVLEEQFGLKIVLNSIKQNQIRRISKASVGSNQKQSDEQLPKSSDISEFGFDVNRDLMKNVSGKSEDDMLQTCIFGSRVKHEMALEAAVVYDLCHNRVHALGAWDYVSHQVIASPFKPIDYMDKIDVLAMRYLPNTKIPCKYLVTELKKDTADNATIDQVLKYVDWVCSEYAYGDYEAVEACIIAAEYPEDIAAYYSEVVQRYYTLGSHPVRNKQWNSLKLLRYSYAAGELSYVDVTPQNEMPG